MEHITTADLDHLVELISEEIAEDVNLRNDYSGRAMYGKPCIGFVVDNSTMFLMALTAILIEMDADGHDVPNWRNLSPRTDSMGLSTIVYFPGWLVNDED